MTHTFSLALAITHAAHPLHDMPAAAGAAMRHWGLLQRVAVLDATDDMHRALKAAGAAPSRCVALANLSECFNVRGLLSRIGLEHMRLLSAEAVMLGVSPGFREPHDTIRALVVEGFRRLSDDPQTALAHALAEAVAFRAMHPYLRDA